MNNPTQQSKVAVNQNLSQWCGDADDWGSDSEADDENGNIETGRWTAPTQIAWILCPYYLSN